MSSLPVAYEPRWERLGCSRREPIHQLELKSAVHKCLSAQIAHEGLKGPEGEGSFDAEVYENVRTLLPPERFRSHLESFDAQLTAVFGAGLNDGGWEQAAYKLASQAGILGFPALSERCRELAQSSATGEDASEAFAKAKAAASQARPMVAELLGHL